MIVGVARALALQANQVAAQFPFLTGSLAFSGRYFVGDVIAQRIEGKKVWDWQRSAAFAGFGFGYASTAGYFIYNKIYPRLLKGKPLQTAVVDVFGNNPFVYFPSFYVYNEAVFAKLEKKSTKPADVIRRGMDRWRTNFFDDLKMGVAVWIPLHASNFALFPLRFRLPVMAVQGVVWVGVLSYFRGDRSKS